MAGTEVRAATLDARGLRGDRRWMVVDAEGCLVSPRTHPALLRVRPRRQARAGAGWLLEAPGRPPCRLEASTSGRLTVEIWGDAVRVAASEGEADAWLSGYLGAEVRLVRITSESRRTFRSAGDGAAVPVAFPDRSPLHLVAEASVRDLEVRADRRLSPRRFRPNMVISGSPPWDEDTWRRLRVGSLTVRVTGPCARCAVPTLDPETGESGLEPLRTLGRIRRHDGKVWFGVLAAHEREGRLRVGDPVTVEERGRADPPLPADASAARSGRGTRAGRDG